MNQQSQRDNEIASNVLSGSTTMVGVCITIITLFKAMKIHMETLADEIVGIDTSMFIGAAIFAYAALRKENNGRLKKIADLLFFIGMLILLIVGFIIVFSNY